MRVKRLEIQGFKSFKDKTVIHFDHTITGIVGPNGCGKSNIVDAFFWVMGEQSYKHMRGTGSEDLIFNGSSKYSPLGMAEATLVMETDVPDTENAPSGASFQDIPLHLRAKEISVTRRVYRSGEGEYFINGVQARLKDIQELFMDTGVGAKGYSVIEQGQIGKVVNAKPEERRLLIEEAAGIAKYKARKKESLRKMEATQANLSRLNDVVQEIERNLNSLERQAQKARQYKKYKDELIDKEMTWGRRKTQVIRQRLEALKSQRDAMEQELVGLKAELQIAENSIETVRIEQLTDSKTAEDLQSVIQRLAAQLAEQKSALELSRRRQGDLASQLESLNQEKSELELSISEEREKLAVREEEAAGIDGSFLESSRQAQAADEAARAARQEAEAVRRKLDGWKREQMLAVQSTTDLTSRAASLLAKIEGAEEQAEKLRSQVEILEAKVGQVRDESENTQASIEELKSKKESLRNEKRELSETVQGKEQELRALERAHQDAIKAATQVRSRLQSLEELDAAHEGFGDGPKAILDWAQESGHGEKVHALADSFEVKAGYEQALEGWLDHELESLISEDSSVAIEALARLGQEKQGRASIVVGSGEQAATADFAAISSRLGKAGFEILGELSQYVAVNEKRGGLGKSAAERMISRVCVVESMTPLAGWMSANGVDGLSGWSIVARDGSTLDHRGILRGGSTQSGQAGSVLGRKRAIVELKEQVALADQAAAEAEERVRGAKQDLDLSRSRLQALQGDLQEVEVQSAALERDFHQINRALKDAVHQLEYSQEELRETLEEAEQAKISRTRIEEQLVELQAKAESLSLQIAEEESGVADREAQVRAREDEAQRLRVEEASKRERTSSLKRELDAGRSLISDRERRLAEVARILERATREHEQHTGGDSDLESQIASLTTQLADFREKLSLVKDRLERTTTQVNSSLDRIKELHSIGDQKTSESNGLSLEIEKLSGELTHLIQNLEEKYGPGCLERPVTSPIQEEMSDPVVTAEMSAEEEQLLGEEVERLRERIRRLGEVNVMAIEEFEETKKRYDHILAEKSDLERSIENLQEAIEHINKTSEDRFRRAFEAIADRFERLFPIIFGGGQAKLSLVYPEGSTEILDAGVDILAQPPGKKVVNIQLLSGGEKALTAVSLIFAIFMVKPSPFCVLDEVDAPLDDANIGKFNALLKEMSAKSQFILITHNKKTMELNDTLYGVTMEEPGVSKMVSIEMQ